MMYWEILGISPTDDMREIKSAYARKAKEFNPEEHPEEFKRVHDAYKNACAYAKRRQRGQETIIVPKPSEHEKKHNDLFEDISSVRKADSKKDGSEEESPYDFADVMSKAAPLDEKSSSAADEAFESCAEEMRKILDDIDLRRSASVWKQFFADHPTAIFRDDRFVDKAEWMFKMLPYGTTFPQQTTLVIINGFGGSPRIQRVVFSDRLRFNTNHTPTTRNISGKEKRLAAVVVLIAIIICVFAPLLQHIRYERGQKAEIEKIKTEYSAPDVPVPRLALGKWEYELGTLTIRGTTYKIVGNDGSVRSGTISQVQFYDDKGYETVYLDKDMNLSIVTLYGELIVKLREEDGSVYDCTRTNSTDAAVETE